MSIFEKPLPPPKELAFLISKFHANFNRIKIENPNRADCTWVIGLTDNYDTSQDSVQYSNVSEAKSLIEYIFSQNYTNIARGEDLGSVAFQNVVYIQSIKS